MTERIVIEITTDDAGGSRWPQPGESGFRELRTSPAFWRCIARYPTDGPAPTVSVPPEPPIGAIVKVTNSNAGVASIWRRQGSRDWLRLDLPDYTISARLWSTLCSYGTIEVLTRS